MPIFTAISLINIIEQPYRVTKKVQLKLGSKDCLVVNLIDKEYVEWRANGWNEIGTTLSPTI